MALELTSQNYKKYIIIGLILFFLIILGYYIFSYGLNGFSMFFSNIIWWLVILAVIVLIIVIIWLLFIYEKFVDVNHEVYKDIKEESNISKPDNLGQLYLKGNVEHMEVHLGKIIGYGLRQNYKITTNKQEEITNLEPREDESVFMLKRKGILKYFSKPIILRTPKRLHSRLQGNVYLDCVSVVKHGLYYYPNSIHLDFEAIDDTLYYDGWRWLQLDFISKLHPIVISASGLTRRQLQELEGKTGMEQVKDTTAQVRR